MILEYAKDVHVLRPVPLVEDQMPAAEYPLDALGEILGSAAKDIFEGVQVPSAIAGQSVLAAAALVAQARRDIEIDGRRIPLSLNVISIAESGDRKSTADNIALEPIHDHQQALMVEWKEKNEQYENDMITYKHKRAELLKEQRDLGSLVKPTRPTFPLFLSQEPTLEGIHNSFYRGRY